MRALFAAFVLALLALLAAPCAQAAWGMPDALTERGQAVGHIYDIIIVLGIIVFVIVFVWLVVVIWRFRETTGHGRATHERERHNIWAELAWFIIPLAMVLYIGGIAYAGLVELDHGIAPEDVAPENHVLITASQWSWQATYPNGVSINSAPAPGTGAVKNESVFYIPADTAILFNVTATDVIHAFQVLDANHAFVIFVDANPLGLHKHNLQTATFPAGEYYVQCNKMCLNPGHAIMRARIKAVPQAEYDRWSAQHAAAISPDPAMRGAPLLAVPLKVSGAQLVGADGKAAGPFTVVAGTRVVVDLAPPSEDITLSAGNQSKTIRAGEAGDTFFAFDVKAEGEHILHGSNGADVHFNAILATRLTVTLKDFALEPEHIDLKAGKTYLITVPNVGAATHDLHLGHYTPGAPESGAIDHWYSAGVSSGGSASFVVTIGADQKGNFDMWCNQPSHHDLGMHGTVTIS